MDCGALDEGFLRDSSVALCLSAGQTVLIRVSHFGVAVGDGLFQMHVAYAYEGDTDFDGDVDVDDLISGVILNWGCADPSGGCVGDIDCDGDIDVDDLVGVILNWDICP